MESLRLPRDDMVQNIALSRIHPQYSRDPASPAQVLRNRRNWNGRFRNDFARSVICRLTGTKPSKKICYLLPRSSFAWIRTPNQSAIEYLIHPPVSGLELTGLYCFFSFIPCFDPFIANNIEALSPFSNGSVQVRPTIARLSWVFRNSWILTPKHLRSSSEPSSWRACSVPVNI